MKALAQLASRSAPLVVIGILLATLLPLAGLINFETGEVRIRIDPSPERLLPEDDPEWLYNSHVRKMFGSDDAIVIGYNSGNALAQASLEAIKTLADALYDIKGVHHVVSLADVPVSRAIDGGFEVTNPLRWVESNPGNIESLRQYLQTDPLYSNRLISADAATAGMVIVLGPADKQDPLHGELIRRVKAMAADKLPAGQYWITGAPIIQHEMSHSLLDSLSFAVPAIVIMITIVLIVAFRSWVAVLLSVATITLALIWTMGTLAWLDRPVNLVTSIVPPVIITLGLAYAMHLLAEYFAASKDENHQLITDNAARIKKTLSEVSLPLLVTGVTTAAGFLALMLNPLAAVKEFAVLSAMGVGYTVFLCLVFLPAGLKLLQCPSTGKAPGEALFHRFAMMLAGTAVRYRGIVLTVGIAVLLITLIGATRIQVGSEYIDDFHESSSVRQDYMAFNQAFGGANGFSVVVDAQLRDGLTDPYYLNQLDDLANWLREQPEIGSVVSVTDHIKRIYASFNDGDPTFYRIPDDRRLIKQLIVFGGGDEIQSYINSTYDTGHIQVRTSVSDSQQTTLLLARIRGRLAKLEHPLAGRVTGTSVLVTSAVDDIARGQAISIGVAMLVVFVILSALFTSWRAGFWAMLPNVIPVSVYFGMLGFTGIPLSPTTSLIACIVLGIAVDDTIHYLARFSVDARRRASEARAVYSALRTVIRPVTFTTIALVTGFLVLTSSELQNQVQFGALAAFTLLIAWLTDILFTPALASGVRIVTLWDVLRLDLGRDPQHSIPLFHGLNVRQARTFALMSHIEKHKAGTRIITDGEEGDDMYVVIEGDLDVWVERDNQRRRLTVMRRGNVIGEVGYFAHRRTANVDAMTDVRLLRFNAADLEALRQRRPRIAATVFRNLNRAQAERLVRTTAQVQ